ncbi:Transposon Ty3-I Gag-Pol polyprotein [Labeo rohita]|uniref:Gypsy retrotransposon integrase-like protein 1 n=1 Tax=Labeo rohita TaxID=84645 RepID=A0ABQ8M9R5_LABRO|nr:Transposon Ty3-I Gag-Pol polyprotein [Labeo rohita]
MAFFTVSRRHQPQPPRQSHQPPTPVHSHLTFNEEHLHPLTGTTYKHIHLIPLSAGLRPFSDACRCAITSSETCSTGFVIIYIDDILIYSTSLEEHCHHVTQVLERLRQHHLFLKGEKHEFHKTTVHFLGYVITPEEVQMDQGNVDVVQNWPQPSTVKEMQRFLGFANFYCRFIANFSQVSAPLTSLLRKKSKTLTWTPAALDAFHQLKTAFCTAPTLTYPDPHLHFVVAVDASTLGVGAILSQWKGEPPVLHPCAYFSKKLSPAEQSYDIGNWNRYWWPGMTRDVTRYIRGCSVCAITSTPRRLPEGKLVPLLLPRRPWSHLGVDFVTDLPASKGYTTSCVKSGIMYSASHWAAEKPFGLYFVNGWLYIMPYLRSRR